MVTPATAGSTNPLIYPFNGIAWSLLAAKALVVAVCAACVGLACSAAALPIAGSQLTGIAHATVRATASATYPLAPSPVAWLLHAAWPMISVGATVWVVRRRDVCGPIEGVADQPVGSLWQSFHSADSDARIMTPKCGPHTPAS